MFTAVCLLRASASCYRPIVEFHSSGTGNKGNAQLSLPSVGFVGGRERAACLSSAKQLTGPWGPGRGVGEDFIRHQKQINDPLQPFELGIAPAAAGECWEGGSRGWCQGGRLKKGMQ